MKPILIILFSITLIYGLYMLFKKDDKIIQNKNTDNGTVYNTDNSITNYPKKYECYYDQKKIYPELDLVNQNREIILEEYNKVKDLDENYGMNGFMVN